MNAPKTSAARTAAHRQRGRNIGLVLTDSAAIAALDRLAAQLGGITAAVTHALKSAAPLPL